MLRMPLFGIVLALYCPSSIAADPKAVEFFESKIRPVLVEQCQKCHSEKAKLANKLRGGLLLDSSAGWKKGGDTGPAIVPGKPSEGTLLKSLRYEGEIQMPPSGKLPPNVLADFEKWVNDGAVDPRESELIEKPKAGIDLEKGRQFWSLQPPKSQPVPKIEKPKTEVANSIDAFIQAKWNEKGLTPTAMADKRTLVRRASFDLTGLPPTPDEVDAFVADNSPEAWAKLIDRLLASPRHGERWGRYWLDVARYAEDQAHTFSVTPKKNAYLYRDWVIQAFNADMPYDRFVRLQIAGDQMPETSDKFTQLAGLGFMGLGAEYYKNTAREQAIAEELDDRVDTLTRGFLGLTVSCARCHDHKFDPIPTQDYYSIAGIYNGTAFTSTPLVGEAELKLYTAAQEKVKAAELRANSFLTEVGRRATKEALELTSKYLSTARAAKIAKSKLDELAKREGLNRYFLDRWVKYLDSGNASKAPAMFQTWFALKKDASTEEVQAAAEAIQAKLIAVELPDLTPPKGTKGGNKKNADPLTKALFLDPNAPFLLTAADVEKQFLPADEKPKLAELQAEVAKLTKASPSAPLMAHIVSGNGQGMKVYIRGNPATKGDAAPKGFLRVITADTAAAKDYTRLDLANAIASATNPLTARVIVNRVWAWHFGHGLVNTPSNFGALGDRPSHPELLDYLAVEFVKNGWSLKWLHRQILGSNIYRLSSDSNPESEKLDAANVYLARGSRKRLDVEAWRDSLLYVSGDLDPTVGGPTFDLRDPNAKRRTVYAKVSRHELDGLLRMFDFPDANVTADKRNVTTVPQQQLFALNSEFVVNRAKALSARVEKLAPTDGDRITALYRLAFDRLPESREIELAERFLNLPTKSADKLTRWQQFAQTILASNEFLYVD